MMIRRFINTCISLLAAVVFATALIACGGNDGNGLTIPSLTNLEIQAITGTNYDISGGSSLSAGDTDEEIVEAFKKALGALDNFSFDGFMDSPDMDVQSSVNIRARYTESYEETINFDDKDLAAYFAAYGITLSGTAKIKGSFNGESKGGYSIGDWSQEDIDFTLNMEIDTTTALHKYDSAWVKGKVTAKGFTSTRTTVTNIDDSFGFPYPILSISSRVAAAYSYALAYRPDYGKGGKFILNVGLAGEIYDEGFGENLQHYATLELYDNAGNHVKTIELTIDALEELILM
jgi:hypothetical protein